MRDLADCQGTKGDKRVKEGLMALKGSKRVGLFEEESSWLADELRLVVVGG